jgi:hypothetical protein
MVRHVHTCIAAGLISATQTTFRCSSAIRRGAQSAFASSGSFHLSTIGFQAHRHAIPAHNRAASLMAQRNDRVGGHIKR